MSTKLLHIGLPKCGTTFLRNEIFPEIEKKMKIEHLTLSDVLNKKKYYTYRNKIKLKKNYPNHLYFPVKDYFLEEVNF